MNLTTIACTAILLGAVPHSLGLLAARRTLQEGEPTIEALRAKAQDRMRQDRNLFSDEEFREIESVYQRANKNLRDPQAKTTLLQLVEKYPKSNRAGCAVLYLAQMSAGTEREEYLKAAIATHGDAWYGDGAQVGALARVYLADHYAKAGRLDDARKQAEEVKARFPGAVDHAGGRLTEILTRMKLLAQ